MFLLYWLVYCWVRPTPREKWHHSVTSSDLLCPYAEIIYGPAKKRLIFTVKYQLEYLRGLLRNLFKGF